jgi:acetolactate synthase I/III small subunit
MEHAVRARLRSDPAAVTRLVSLLRRRGFDLQSLTLGPCDEPDSRPATMVVRAPDARLLLAQLRRLLDVVHVEIHSHDAAAARVVRA